MANLTTYEYIYYFIHKANTYVESHHHKAYEVIYYVEGQGESETKETCYKYTSGNFILLHPYTEHNEIHKTNTVVLCLTFFLNEKLELREGVYTDNNNEMFKIISQIKEEGFTKQYKSSEMLSCLTEQFAINLLRMQNQNREVYNEVYDIKKFINDNFNMDINIEAIAKKSGYSYDHFRHLFKKYTGVSPKKYLINKRLEHSKKLLSTSTMFITDISTHCGFANISEFSYIFKKFYGISPTQYRCNYQQV